MYSILIKDEQDETKWSFFSKNGSVFTGTLTEVKSQFVSLLGVYPSARLMVVHNTTVDLSALTITDVTA